MFNKVLSRYTGNFDNLPHNVSITHMHNWVKHWYRHAFGCWYPAVDRFRTPNWDKIREEVASASSDVKEELYWGHLVIDEGQDFPPSMYACLSEVLRCFKGHDSKQPTLTVFADDNQTITEKNSSIQEITEELNVSYRNRRYWRLVKNYRNMREVAELARYYQLEDVGSAELPDKKLGEKPSFFVTDFNREFQQIVNIVFNSGKVEAGVIVFGSQLDVVYAHEKIDELANNQCKVQGYIGRKGHPLSNHESLEFDSPPSITVVHSRSAKGLEFDIVFLVKLESLGARDAGEIDSYKTLYVATSRARSRLFGFIHGSLENGFPEATRLLPNPNENLCSYMSTENWGAKLGELLDDVDWAPSASVLLRQTVREAGLVQKILGLGAKVAIEFLEKAASREIKRHVHKTVINQVIESGSEESLEDLILDIGVQYIKKTIDEEEQ